MMENKRWGYFIGDLWYYIFDSKGNKKDLGNLDKGIYQSSKLDSFVVSENSLMGVQEIKEGELKLGDIKYLKALGKVVKGRGEINLEGEKGEQRVIYTGLDGKKECLMKDLYKYC